MALAAVAVMACAADVALADPSDTLLTATIYKPGAQPTTESVTAGSLESRPEQCPVYGKTAMTEVNGQGQSAPWPLGTDTWTLTTILSCLQPVAVQAADSTGGVTVFQSDGSPESSPASLLSTGDLATPSDFNDPSDSPVVSDQGSSRQYNRPWRGSSDENQLDQVTSDQGGAIVISVFEGHQIQVSASASPTTVAQGGTVSFSASASGSGLSYQWNFGGGAPSSTQQNPQVTFNTEGTYAVTLLVTDDTGDDGHYQLTIQVGPPSSTTPTSPGTVTTGPAKSSGTTPTGTQGPPKSGGGPPAHKPTHQRTSTPTSPPTGDKGTHKKTTQTRTTQTSTTPPGSGSGSGGGGSSGSGSSGSGSGSSGSSGAGTPSSAASPKATPTPRKPKAPTATSHPAPPVSGAPRVVTGQLISDVVAVPESASPLVHAVAAATPAAAPAVHLPSRSSLLPLIGSVLAVLALLGAGAQRELRVLGRWLPLRARA